MNSRTFAFKRHKFNLFLNLSILVLLHRSYLMQNQVLPRFFSASRIEEKCLYCRRCSKAHVVLLQSLSSCRTSAEIRRRRCLNLTSFALSFSWRERCPLHRAWISRKGSKQKPAIINSIQHQHHYKQNPQVTWALMMPCSTLFWCLKKRNFRTDCWMTEAASWRRANQDFTALCAVITFLLSSRYRLLSCLAFTHRYTKRLGFFFFGQTRNQQVYFWLLFTDIPVWWRQNGSVFLPIPKPSELSEPVGSLWRWDDGRPQKWTEVSVLPELPLMPENH